MQAVFRFRGAEEIIVSDQGGGVMVEFFSGYARQCDACQQAGPRAICSNCPKDGIGDGSGLQHSHTEILTKSEARSVASAIMGAAARL
jgi:hypothetical protein